MAGWAKWKRLEKHTGEVLGGTRLIHGGARGDVEHDIFKIECKHGHQVPKFNYKVLEQTERNKEKKIPLGVVRKTGKRALVIMYLKDFARIYECSKSS